MTKPTLPTAVRVLALCAVALCAITFSAGCFTPTFPNGILCAEGELCPGDQICASDNRCYDPGSVPGSLVDAAIPDCQADETVCEGDILATCDSNGNVASTETCALGCAETEPRCKRMVASNGMSEYFDEAEASIDLVLDGFTSEINTTDGIIASGAVVSDFFTATHEQEDGSEIQVFALRSLKVSGALSISGTRPAVLVVTGPIEIDGVVTVQAGSVTCGNTSQGIGNTFPSMYVPANVTPPILSLGDRLPGTAGGSLIATGANGGSSASFPGQTGTSQSAISLVPLPRACGASTLASAQPDPMIMPPYILYSGGRGGGTLHIISNLEIRVGHGSAGSIRAGGAGGRVGAGTGGGSGGAILLEAPVVDLAATGGLSANGGGGGCLEEAGQDGMHSRARAPGGDCVLNGDGGAGGSADGAALTGQSVTGTLWAGGGGGAVGSIEARTRSGELETSAGTTLSPEPTINLVESE